MERYTPFSDEAAFVGFPIYADGKLIIWVDIDKAQNIIMEAVKKLLDEFRPRVRRTAKDKAVDIKGVRGKYLELHVDLKAPRAPSAQKRGIIYGFIEPEIVQALQSHHNRLKEATPRLYEDAMRACFQIFDQRVHKDRYGWQIHKIASGNKSYLSRGVYDLEREKSVLYKQYERAWRLVDSQPPETSIGYAKQKKRKLITLRGISPTCTGCDERPFCTELCESKKNIADQDDERPQEENQDVLSIGDGTLFGDNIAEGLFPAWLDNEGTREENENRERIKIWYVYGLEWNEYRAVGAKTWQP